MDTPTSLGESPTSPPSSTKKRFWSSFRNKTSKKFRRKHKSNEVFVESLSASQPSICNDKQTLGSSSDDLLDNVYSAHEIETREKMSRKRLTKAERNVESSPDRSLSDPNVTPLKDRVTNRTFSGSGQSHSDENFDRDEDDSGIAVIEHSGITEVSRLKLEVSFCLNILFVASCEN